MYICRNMVHRVAYLGIGLVAGLLVAGHNAPRNPIALAQQVLMACGTATPEAKPAATAGPTIPKKSVVTIKLNGHLWRLTYSGASIHSSIHSTWGTSRARGKFVFVFLTAQNMDKRPQFLAYDQNFALVDSQGRTFSWDADPNTAVIAEQTFKRDDAASEVEPTLSAQVVFTFDVAVDAHGFVLVNTDEFSGSTTKLYALGF